MYAGQSLLYSILFNHLFFFSFYKTFDKPLCYDIVIRRETTKYKTKNAQKRFCSKLHELSKVHMIFVTFSATRKQNAILMPIERINVIHVMNVFSFFLSSPVLCVVAKCTNNLHFHNFFLFLVFFFFFLSFFC